MTSTDTKSLLISRRKKEEWLAAYAFLTPTIVGLLLFVAFPLIASFYFSLTEWSMLAPPKFIGLENYRTALFGDPITCSNGCFWQSVVNTLRFIVLGPTSYLLLALLLALLANKQFKGRNLFRAICFMPVVVSLVSAAITWRWLFNVNSGTVNQLLGMIGLPGPAWLTDASYAMGGIAIATTWKTAGIGMTFLLAGLQDIPRTLYEAADIDGANAWTKFRYITLPMLTPTIFYLLITTLIGAFQLYDVVLVMTAGGPFHATETIVYHLTNKITGFGQLQAGYASAVSWILFVILFVLTLINVRLSKRWVFYDR